MSTIIDKVYPHLPIPLQNIVATGYGVKQRLLRHGGRFNAFVRELSVQERWPAERLAALQAERLSATLTHAARTVPHYRDLFARLRLTPADIRTPAELLQLPLLEKTEVMADPQRFRSEAPGEKVVAQTTGGTTGSALTYYATATCVQFNYAVYEARFRAWAGVAFGDRMASLNGKPIVPMGQVGPPFWRHNLAFNQLYLSAYHLADGNLPAYIDALERFRPRVIVGYTSAVLRLAQWIVDHGQEGCVRPRAVLVSSETLWPWARAIMERAFLCKVHNGYSLGEPVVFITECERGSMHVSPEYGVCELVADGLGQHEIVATSLMNTAMPLLRYRTRDLAEPGTGAPCPCGRTLPTIGAIVGRVDDEVVTPEGAHVGPASLSLVFQAVPRLKGAQIIQDDVHAIRLDVCGTPEFGRADEDFLITELRKRLGHSLRVDVRRVESIPLTSGGKRRLVVSSLHRRRQEPRA